MTSLPQFLAHTGRSGPFGALMDVYARAADEFCRVIEGIDLDRFRRTRESVDPDTTSIQSICAHAIGAAHRYADYILEARRMPFVERFEFDPALIKAPDQVREKLAE